MTRYSITLTLAGLCATAGTAEPPPMEKPFGPTAKGHNVHQGSKRKVECVLVGQTLTVIIDGDNGPINHELARERGTPGKAASKNLPTTSKPKDPLVSDPNPEKTEALRACILAVDKKMVAERFAKLSKEDRLSTWATYRHTPFVGTFSNGTITLTIKEDHVVTIKMGDQTFDGKLTPARFDPKKLYDPREPFAAGHPLLLDLLTAFGPDGYDIWLNAFLTPEMVVGARESIQLTEVFRWADGSQELQSGQRVALRNWLESFGVLKADDLDPSQGITNKKLRAYYDEYAKRYGRDLLATLIRHNLFDD